MISAQPSLALFTDLYELTMAQAYWKSGVMAQSTFSLFFRKLPPDRGYLVFAGLEDVLDYLENFRFSDADLEHLRSLNRFDSDFLAFLANLRFTGSLRALAEGSLFFPQEPVLEVTGPILEAQLMETFLVNQTHFQSLLATKAARVVTAARGRGLIDFGARRTHGVETANKLARLAFMVGFRGTSNVLAGALYRIRTFGTMAHSFVTCFSSEIDSFRHYANAFPDDSTFLVDTYDTLEGTRKAIAVAREMKQAGHRLKAIRLDSGDLLDLSRKARALLDEAGLSDVQVVASGGLDEFEVEALVNAGAPIDVYCVGTKVGVSADAPMTDCAYKLVEYSGRPVLKLSTKKQTLPGPKQVFRRRDPAGRFAGDLIGQADETPPPDSEPLLGQVMRNGKRLLPQTSLDDLQQRFLAEFSSLPDQHKALRSPQPYDVRISSRLQEFRDQVVQETKKRELPA